MTINWNVVTVIAAVGLYGYLAWMLCRRQISAGLKRVREMPRGLQAFFGIIAVIATVEAQKAGTNDTNSASGGTNMMMSAGHGLGNLTLGDASNWGTRRPRRVSIKENSSLVEGGEDAASPSYRFTSPSASSYTLTTNDVLRGFAVISQIAVATIELPTNAVIVGNWHKHGAASMWGVHKTDFPGFDFPFGTNNVLSSSSWYFPDGRIRADLFDESTEIDTGIGPLVAIPGRSILARSDGDDGSSTMYWKDFFSRTDTNTPVTAAITLYPNGDFARLVTNVWEQCADVNPLNWMTISAPSLIMRNGYTNTVSVALNAPFNTDASISIDCVEGAEKLNIVRIDSQTLQIQGAATSESLNDVKFEATAMICGNTYTATHRMTVASVKYLHAESNVQGVSTNPPPFVGEEEHPFSITNSPLADQHLVIPFCNVATQTESGFSIADFTVYMSLELEPQGVIGYDLEGNWELIEAYPQTNGTLVTYTPVDAEFCNPKLGGVYRFRARVGGSPWTEANIVLPLCGASVENVFEADMPLVYTAMTNVCNKYEEEERVKPSFGRRWFVWNGNGDYAGRVDNASFKTIWPYNQVNDTSGFGAVATWYGYPTRMAKLSNLIVGYCTEMIGVSSFRQWVSQGIGTWNDSTATMSWDCGVDLASGGSITTNCSVCAFEMWAESDEKVKRLWPNIHNADNHSVDDTEFDFNHYFWSPGLIKKGLSLSEE